MILTSSSKRRKMSLTPMIDVVFLLLVFFMLAAKFGVENTLQLTAGEGGQAYQGSPRLVDIYPDQLRLNGIPIEMPLLADRLATLMDSKDDAIVLRSREASTVQRLIDVIQALNSAGLVTLVLVE